MLKLKNVSIGYKNSAPIIQKIDAELSVGTFCCLVGRNGTGKSTLLRSIAGMQPILEGALECPPSVAIALTQVPTLANTKVKEMVAYGRLGETGWLGRLKAEDLAMADKAIQMVGIEQLAERWMNQLSDGEKQKTMIARCIAQGSPLLLLDEPSAFLDYPSRRELMSLLQMLAHNHKKIILLSTHDVELAIEYADSLWLLKEHTLHEKTPQDFHPEEL